MSKITLRFVECGFELNSSFFLWVFPTPVLSFKIHLYSGGFIYTGWPILCTSLLHNFRSLPVAVSGTSFACQGYGFVAMFFFPCTYFLVIYF